MSDFPGWPAYSDAECAAVAQVLGSNRVNYWTGEQTRLFETGFAERVGVKHALALSNGTVALELALSALGVGVGDEVIVTPRSFIASVASVVSRGARPVFADVDADSQNLSAATVEPMLSDRTRAIVVVHLAGRPAEMSALLELARARGVHVIEDCAQAHGARYRGRSVGALGTLGTWSFCVDKIMTTGGEGGMVTTDDDELAESIRAARDHGKSSAALASPETGIGFRWLHESFGTNGRMTEMQGVLGRLQLAELDGWQRRRLENANALWRGCADIDWLRIPDACLPSHLVHAAYRAYVFVRPERLPPSWGRDRILQALQERGMPAFAGSCAEIYRERAFEATDFTPPERLSVARRLGETSLAFLVHPTLDATHMQRIVGMLHDIDRSVVQEREPA